MSPAGTRCGWHWLHLQEETGSRSRNEVECRTPSGQIYQSDFIDGLGLEPDRTEDGDPGDDLEYV
jgi:hypothetical protein